MKVRRALAIGSALAVLGCGGRDFQPATVSVKALNPKEETVPIPGAELVLLPFDIDSLYAALEKRNQAGPPPDTAAVEPLFDEFYHADTALMDADSALTAQQAALAAIADRKSDEYREAFKAYEQAQARRDSLAAARDSAEARYSAARREYSQARATWEASAWDGFTEAQDKLYANVPAPRDSAGKDVGFTQKTGNAGTFTVHLAPRKWWVAGRVPAPGSVHELYRWNVPFTVADEPVRLELTAANAKVVFTY